MENLNLINQHLYDTKHHNCIMYVYPFEVHIEHSLNHTIIYKLSFSEFEKTKFIRIMFLDL